MKNMKNFKSKKLPQVNSYIELEVKHQYGKHIWKGIIGHHDDNKYFFIKSDNSTLTSINPNSKDIKILKLIPNDNIN